MERWKFFTKLAFKSLKLLLISSAQISTNKLKGELMALSEGQKKRKAKKAVKGIKSKPTARQARARRKANSMAKSKQTEHGGRAHRRRND